MRIDTTIERLGHQGDGIAQGPLYAVRVLPGERVSGVVDGTRLTDIRIEEPSSDRVQAPCRHYRSCGGCQLQHASDSFVAGWKQEIVRSALTMQGIDADLRPISTSPAQSRRRASFAVRRTKKGALAGFYGRASDVITSVPDCRLLDPGLIPALGISEALCVLGGSRKGVLAVKATLSENGLDLAVGGGKSLDGPLELALAQAAETHGLARLSWDNEVIATREPPVQRFGSARVVPPPGAFLQATQEGEAALVAAVREITAQSARVSDLFAGCGTFTLPLASHASVHAVEGDRDMLRSLDRAWRQTQGLKSVTTEVRDLFRQPLLPEELRHFDAVVLDPPRAGAEAQVAELTEAMIPVIAYVSCNPITFARDAKRLIRTGYRLNWVQVVDQFRWSAHVELAASFTLAHTGAE